MSAKPRAVYIDPEQERGAISYLRQKAGQIGFDYRQVWHGITGTKSPELELLVDLFVIANEALALDPFQQLVTFSDHVAPSLVKRGWSNPKKSTDPGTGASVLPRFAGPACLKAIYDANLRIVHAEDRWQRIQAAKGALPYLLYDHTPSAWQRPEHAAWDGLVLPVDDPWWLRHYPPRAWGCRCRVIQLGDRQLERLGKGIDQAPAETYTGYTNPRSAARRSAAVAGSAARSAATAATAPRTANTPARGCSPSICTPERIIKLDFRCDCGTLAARPRPPIERLFLRRQVEQGKRMASTDPLNKKQSTSDKDYGKWHFFRDVANHIFGLLNTGNIFPLFFLAVLVCMGLIVWRLPESELAPLIRDLIAWMGSETAFAWAVAIVGNLAWFHVHRAQKALYRGEIARLTDQRSQLMHGENLTLIKNHRTSDGEHAETYLMGHRPERPERPELPGEGTRP